MAALRSAAGVDLAFAQVDGRGPTIVWLCGFKSDMGGTKAVALSAWAAREGRSFLRFDYSGHGASGGAFRDGCISRWTADALEIIDGLTAGPLLLVGSSMGGWIALRIAQMRPARVGGLVFVAPAPDFTTRMERDLPEEARAALARDGVWLRPSAYGDDPYPITAQLIEDGRACSVLGGPIAFSGPVRILQGQQDADVPWRGSLELAERLTSRDVVATFVKDGDHRLSTADDIARLCAVVEECSQAMDKT